MLDESQVVREKAAAAAAAEVFIADELSLKGTEEKKSQATQPLHLQARLLSALKLMHPTGF